MGLFSSKSKVKFPWVNLESETQLMEALNSNHIVVLFKHSTRCSISTMALSRFEANFIPNENVLLLYLDLLSYRGISAKIAESTGIEHQSPQIIVLRNKELIYTATHNGIDASELMNILK
jgi:bacillithiol system protein YtxJ